MPKKTKLFGWQCSYCVSSSSDGSVKSAPDVDEPRKLRETIKEPDKFFHLSHIQDSLKRHQKKSLLNKRNRQRRDAAKARKIGSLQNSSKQEVKNRSHDAVRSRVKSRVGEKISAKKMPSYSSRSHLRTSTSSSAATAAAAVVHAAAEGSRAQDIMCIVCNRDGGLSDTVRCDECMLFYHLNCLDPPMKKSPKVSG